MTKKWICTVCKYVHEGPEPPERCPVCGAPSEKLEPLEQALGELAPAPAAETDTRIPLPHIRGYNCFGCGTENPQGLHLSFYASGEHVCSDVTLSHAHEGWQNMAHGGIISTVLDEIMAWTVIAFQRVFFVTGRMVVDYLRPVPVEVPLLARGAISDEPYARGCIATGEILDGSGTLLARGRGEFVHLPEDKLTLIPQHLKDAQLRLYARMEELFGDRG